MAEARRESEEASVQRQVEYVCEVALNIEERELEAGHEVFDSSSKIVRVFQLT